MYLQPKRNLLRSLHAYAHVISKEALNSKAYLLVNNNNLKAHETALKAKTLSFRTKKILKVPRELLKYIT